MERKTATLTALLLTTFVSAQSQYKRPHLQMLDEAKSLLVAEDYAEAAKIYKRLLPVDTAFVEVYYEYGLCLVNLPGQKDKAVPYFEKAQRGGHTEAFYELALARHRQQRFDEAADLLNRYKQLHYRAEKDVEVDRHISMAVTAKQLVSTPVDVTIRNMGPMINSPAHDYCPLVTADGNTMYFTSRRQGTTGGLKDDSGQWLEDIYTAKRLDEVWSNAVNVGAPLNTTSQDATVGLNPDGSSMIVYHTSKDLVSGDLYETNLHAREWQLPQIMTPMINSEFHEPSASIAPGGDEIYFTSDRPGGFGGRDLYRIRRLPNGEWSKPLNLGPNVNTANDEDAPFVHSDGITLFFSSNGHNTMGGFDIFKTTLLDADMNGWAIPENLGYPLNTVNDDIYFCLSDDGYTGYFSSERPGGLGLQDIYQVTFPGNQLDYMVARGMVVNASEDPVKARIQLADATGEEIIGVYNTNVSTGRFLMVLTPGERYTMTVEAPGYTSQRSEIVAKATDEGIRELAVDILMVPLEARDRLTRND
ncbi:MAG: tetratricopeptide repeat protein [Flavobacteriales bacterium]